MKSSVIFTLLQVMLVPVFAQQTLSYSIKANIKNIPDGIKFYLIRSNDGRPDTVNSIIVFNEKFELQGNLTTEGELHFLKMDTSNLKLPPGKASWTRIVLESTPLQLTGAVEKWPQVSINGSLASELFETLHKKARQFDSSLKLLRLPLDSIEVTNLRKKYKYFLDSFSIANPTSRATSSILFFFQREVLSEIDQQLLFSRLTPEAQRSFYGKQWSNEIHKKNLRENIILNKTLPDIHFTTEVGELMDIKAIVSKSKYTLIDLWATWCSPCIEEIPYLQKVFHSYSRSDFNIIGICVMDEKQNWEKTIKQNRQLWMQGFDKNNSIKNLLGLSSLPAYLLVNSEGQVIAYQCASSLIKSFGGNIRREELEKKINSLLEKKQKK